MVHHYIISYLSNRGNFLKFSQHATTGAPNHCNPIQGNSHDKNTHKKKKQMQQSNKNAKWHNIVRIALPIAMHFTLCIERCIVALYLCLQNVFFLNKIEKKTQPITHCNSFYFGHWTMHCSVPLSAERNFLESRLRRKLNLAISQLYPLFL